MSASAAHAQTDVWPDPVVKQEAAPLPLWLPRFVGEGDMTARAQRLEQIVLADLQFSGLFDIHREEPEAAGMSPGTNAVCVRGKVFRDATGMSFEGTVTDIASNDFMGGKKYRLTDTEIRKVAHHFADEVVRLVTGNTGIASTQLVYTRKVGDKWELVVSDYDGYNPRSLVRQTMPLLSPRWMDRANAVVYTTFRDGKADLLRALHRGQQIEADRQLPRDEHGGRVVTENGPAPRGALEGRQHRDLFAGPRGTGSRPAHAQPGHRHEPELGAERQQRRVSLRPRRVRRSST